MKIKGKNVFTALITLSFIFCFVAIPVQAAHPLKATTSNTNLLYNYPSSAWVTYGSSQWLNYSYANGLIKGYSALSGYKYPLYVGSIKGVKINDQRSYSNPAWDGQCVGFVKAMSDDSTNTDIWIKGKQVSSGSISGGTAIATFGSDNHYFGHTALFGNKASSSSTNIWDQNYGHQAVGRHIISTGNYNVVEIPDTSIAAHFANTGDKSAVLEPKKVTSNNNQLEFFRMHSDYFTIQYCAYVTTKGWQSYVNEDTNAGTQGFAIQAFKIKLVNQPSDTHVYYRAYYNNAWGPWVSDYMQAGTTSVPIKGMQVYIGTGKGDTLYSV